MTDHPDLPTFELFTMGALENDEAFVAHVAGCDACSSRLAEEARLELLLGGLRPRRRNGTKVARVALPLVALAVAAAALLAVRGAGRGAITADPTATTAAASVSGPDLPPGAEAVVAELRPKLRQCYQMGLVRDPHMEGSTTISLDIAAAGHVTQTSVAISAGLSEEVRMCLAQTAAKATFAACDHASTLRIPLTFVQTK